MYLQLLLLASDVQNGPMKPSTSTIDTDCSEPALPVVDPSLHTETEFTTRSGSLRLMANKLMYYPVVYMVWADLWYKYIFRCLHFAYSITPLLNVSLLFVIYCGHFLIQFSFLFMTIARVWQFCSTSSVPPSELIAVGILLLRMQVSYFRM